MKYLCLIIAAVFLVATSCTKPVDFDQANDFEATPAIESSFMFLNESAGDFFDYGAFVSIQDFILVDFFNNDFIQEDLVRAELELEIVNSINRGFEIQVDFLDALDQSQHSFTVEIDASADNSDLLFNHTEVFIDSKLNALKQTQKIVFTLSILPGDPIDENTIGRIQLQSKVLFYLNTTF